MGLKLEVGKCYRDAAGEKRGPMQLGESMLGQYHHFEGSRGSFKPDGTSWIGADPNLIAEWSDAPTGPVRTVTRKEIVPGVYGAVSVLLSDGVWVALTSKGDHVAHIKPSAAELRAAIATLTEIADALEEQ